MKSKILRRLGLTFFVLFPLLSFFGVSYFSMQFVSPEKQPWVSWFGDPAHEVYISWETETDSDGLVKYGESFDNLLFEEISSLHTTIHHVILTGLNPNTIYYFKTYKDGSEHGSGSFTTASLNGSGEYRFAVISDTQQQIVAPGGFQRVANTLNLKNYRFIAHIGDFVDEGTEKWQYDHFFAVGSKLFQHTPIVPVVGNHDRFGRNSSLFAQYFINHENRSQFYYSFDYGNAHFSVCDYAFVNEGEIKPEQFAWLEQDLINAQGQPFRIVMFHRPIATDGFHRSSENLTNIVLPLLNQYNVQLVLSGHEHSYERLYLGNLTQLVVGCGGGTFDPGLIAHNTTIKNAVSPSYVELAINSTAIAGQCLTLEGALIDEFVIPISGIQ